MHRWSPCSPPRAAPARCSPGTSDARDETRTWTRARGDGEELGENERWEEQPRTEKTTQPPRRQRRSQQQQRSSVSDKCLSTERRNEGDVGSRVRVTIRAPAALL